MAVGTGRGSRPARRLTRASAVLTMLMAPIVLEPTAVSGARGYAVVLAASVAVGALLVAHQLWRDGGLAAQISAGSLAAVVLIGQVAVCTVGDPTGSAPHWPAFAVLLIVLAAVLLATVVAEVRTQPQIHDEAEKRPYAL